MSVLKNNRAEAKAQFVLMAQSVTRNVSAHTHKIPKKLQLYVTKEVESHYFEAYKQIILGNAHNTSNEAGKEYQRMCLKTAIYEYSLAQQGLYAFWNVEKTPGDKIALWVKGTNKVIRMIGGVIGMSKSDIPYLRKLDRQRMKKSKFVNAIADLHNYTVHQLGYVNNVYGNLLCKPISDYAARALYCAIEGNRMYPNDRCSMLYRYKYFIESLANLNAMQYPIMSLFSLKQVGSDYQEKWCEKYDDAVKLMNAIIKYQKEKIRTEYGDLSSNSDVLCKFVDLEYEDIMQKIDNVIEMEKQAENSKRSNHCDSDNSSSCSLGKELDGYIDSMFSDEELGINYQETGDEIIITDKEVHDSV